MVASAVVALEVASAAVPEAMESQDVAQEASSAVMDVVPTMDKAPEAMAVPAASHLEKSALLVVSAVEEEARALWRMWEADRATTFKRPVTSTWDKVVTLRAPEEISLA